MLLVVEVGAVVEVTLVAVVVVGTVVVRVAVVDVVVAILRRSRKTGKVAFLSERDLASWWPLCGSGSRTCILSDGRRRNS